MMINGNDQRIAALSHRTGFSAEVMNLLSVRAERYEMGDTSSLRTETAEELLTGVLFCIRLALSGKEAIKADAVPAETLFERGLAETKRLVKRGRLLLYQANSGRPDVLNIGMTDTLDAISTFFAKYDPDFFAHRIPCDIDYPLCHPVSEELQGISYINTYLRRLIVENAFLKKLSPDRLRTLFKSYLGDYVGLLVNLYLPTAEAAIGCALAGRDPSGLSVSQTERGRVLDDLRGQRDDDVTRALSDASDAVCKAFAIGGAAERDYLLRTALDIIPRIRAAASTADAEGLFPSIPAHI